jgi:thioester reductase-like protein
MSTDNRDERLARRMTDSYAIERQFAGARPIEAITAAINRPGVRMPEVVRTVPVQRIPDYDGWLQRFETSLCALREQERQHSLLPLLHRYRRRQKPIRGALAPTDRFGASVQDAKISPDKDIPHITAPIILNYITHLQLLALL